MVFNIGGGTSQAAILSMGGIVASRTIPRAGRSLDRDLMEYVKRAHNVEIGERTAEDLKIRIGTADASAEVRALEVRGRDVVNGLPRSIRLTSDELFPIVDDFAASLVDTIRATLELCPPELAGDVVEQGILLCGGGSLLGGIDQRIRRDTRVPVQLADRPLECAAIGAGMML
jgi:rod shape-determining protein MreB